MKKRYLLIAAAFVGFFGLWQMVANRNASVAMAQKIIAKDDAGDDVKADLAALQAFTQSHTRASVKLVLNGSYNRAVQQAQQASAGGGGSSSLYQQATAACTSKNPVATASCITNYVQTHAAPGQQPRPVQLPDQSKYQYVLNSPAWTFDAAGLAFLAAAVLLALALYFGIVNRSRKTRY